MSATTDHRRQRPRLARPPPGTWPPPAPSAAAAASVDALVRWLCIGATLVGLFFLASLLLTLLWRGLEALDWTMLTREFEPTTYGDDTAAQGRPQPRHRRHPHPDRARHR